MSFNQDLIYLLSFILQIFLLIDFILTKDNNKVVSRFVQLSVLMSCFLLFTSQFIEFLVSISAIGLIYIVARVIARESDTMKSRDDGIIDLAAIIIVLFLIGQGLILIFKSLEVLDEITSKSDQLIKSDLGMIFSMLIIFITLCFYILSKVDEGEQEK